jgi:hypothetical protein
MWDLGWVYNFWFKAFSRDTFFFFLLPGNPIVLWLVICVYGFGYYVLMYPDISRLVGWFGCSTVFQSNGILLMI